MSDRGSVNTSRSPYASKLSNGPEDATKISTPKGPTLMDLHFSAETTLASIESSLTRIEGNLTGDAEATDCRPECSSALGRADDIACRLRMAERRLGRIEQVLFDNKI
jgi:hypothetical protein